MRGVRKKPCIHHPTPLPLLSGAKVGDMALHFCNRMGLLVVKLTSKYDLRRLCRATGAVALPRLTPPAITELGHCDHVTLEEVWRKREGRCRRISKFLPLLRLVTPLSPSSDRTMSTALWRPSSCAEQQVSAEG